MLAATAGILNYVQNLWGVFAKPEPLQEVMRKVPVSRMSCAAVRVADERCAEPAFRVAASFMPVAKASADVLACPCVMPRIQIAL